MKILHIIPSVDPKGGGPMEGVRQYGSRAIELGHCIEVLTLDPPDAKYLSDYPLKVYAIGPSLGRYSYNPRLKPWLLENGGSYDAVVINGLWMYHCFGSWRALRKMATPYFVFTHGMLDPWFKRTYPLKHLKKWLYWPWGDYRVLRDAKRVLFTCEQEMHLARESFCLYRARGEVVNYGAGSPPGTELEPMRDTFLQSNPQLRGKRVILFLSRIHEKKGCDLLLQGFASVAHRDGNLHLVMAGPCEGKLRDDLARMASSLGIADRVSWPGMLRGEMKWGAFAAADAFALISHQENFGIAVAEALASGLPVLISDQVNIWREIAADKAGFVTTDDRDGASKVLNQWLDLTNSERDAMRRNATQCFYNRFTAQAMATSITSTIERAIKE